MTVTSTDDDQGLVIRMMWEADKRMLDSRMATYTGNGTDDATSDASGDATRRQKARARLDKVFEKSFEDDSQGWVVTSSQGGYRGSLICLLHDDNGDGTKHLRVHHFDPSLQPGEGASTTDTAIGALLIQRAKEFAEDTNVASLVVTVLAGSGGTFWMDNGFTQAQTALSVGSGVMGMTEEWVYETATRQG